MPLAAAPKWIRRVTAIAACAASAVDAYTTYTAAQRGAIETNPLLQGNQSRPSMTRIIALKAVICASVVATSEFAPRRYSTLVIAVNAGQAAAFGMAAGHNTRR
jgi:hypothetical protein